MRVACFTSLDDLAPHANAWDRLAGGVPFRGWTWLSHWWQHYGTPTNTGPRLAVVCAFDDRALVGVAPCYLDSSKLHGRVLRPLGSGEVCSDYLGLLCQPGLEEPVTDSVTEFLVENARRNDPNALRWDLLAWDAVADDDHATATLIERLARAGCTTHRRPGATCWRLTLPTDCNQYFASLGKNLRRDLRRLERELLDTDRAVLHSPLRINELSHAMDILVELHQRRRTSLGEKGCFASERFLSFFRDVVPALMRRGQLQFHWLEIDGQPVAAEYQLVGGGVLYAYQAGVDPVAMQYEPGKLINLAILRQAIERGYREFDFLRGDEPYKARFGAQPRRTIEYRVVPRRAVARLRHGLWRVGVGARAWVKRGRGAGDGGRESQTQAMKKGAEC